MSATALARGRSSAPGDGEYLQVSLGGAQQKARTRRAIILGRGLSNKHHNVLIANVCARRVFRVTAKVTAKGLRRSPFRGRKNPVEPRMPNGSAWLEWVQGAMDRL